MLCIESRNISTVFPILVEPTIKPTPNCLFTLATSKTKVPCLFLKFSSSSEDRIYIWVHVDDTFVAATTKDLLDEFETVVKSQFKITVKSDVDLYLGIHFDYLPNGDVKITQPKLLQGLSEEYRDEPVMHRARVPITPQRQESSKSTSDEPIDPSEYLSSRERLSILPNHAPIFKLLLVLEPPTLSI